MKNIEILKCRKLDNYHSNDFFSELFARAKKSVVKTLTGIPPLAFTADGTPLIDLLISGNEEHSGTPTPDNPIMPQGTGERTGNLWDNLGFSAGAINTSGIHMLSNNYGTSLSTVSGGSVDITQVASGSTTAYQNGFFFIEIDISQFSIGDAFVIGFDYEITNKAGSTSTTVSYVGQGNTSTNVIADWSNSGRAIIKATVTSAMTKPYVEIRLCGNSIKVRNIQINTGSTALPYEPYGYKIQISSAEQTTPVYLGEVETTRKVKKLVLTGIESYEYQPQYSRYTFTVQDAFADGTRNTQCFCTHYQSVYNGEPIADVPDKSVYINQQIVGTQFCIKDKTYTSATDFKSYLAAQYAAGTPVTVWYVLATEETGIVNEPLMKIGEYADTLSKEQAGVTIPTNNGSTTVDVDTTVKPSEMYIKYMG